VTAPTEFRTGDLFAEFRRQGHNPRTRAAWDAGVEGAATGRELSYQRSALDYADAELQGRRAARRLLKEGRSWVCNQCGHRHSGGSTS
jgi:rubrerythrin